jgi:hypothetical protein
MIILIVLAIGAVLMLTYLTGYRMAIVHCLDQTPDCTNEITPIFDQLASEYPETYLRLITPVTQEIVSWN